MLKTRRVIKAIGIGDAGKNTAKHKLKQPELKKKRLTKSNMPLRLKGIKPLQIERSSEPLGE